MIDISNNLTEPRIASSETENKVRNGLRVCHTCYDPDQPQLDVNLVSTIDPQTLYDARVNPIATFPRNGVVAFGQKTLQKQASALDRINVRRLLIEVKKFIASSSKYLVFEQNTLQTRNRFLGIANPYLESIQQRQGLFAFRVVMDESNNTPDEIDRNRLIGAIYLQPTRTAEFIILDFNILPTGATFDTGGGGGGTSY